MVVSFCKQELVVVNLLVNPFEIAVRLHLGRGDLCCLGLGLRLGRRPLDLRFRGHGAVD